MAKDSNFDTMHPLNGQGVHFCWPKAIVFLLMIQLRSIISRLFQISVVMDFLQIFLIPLLAPTLHPEGQIHVFSSGHLYLLEPS